MHQKERGEVVFGFYTVMVEFYIEDFLWDFLPCGFPEENLCVLCIYVLVVLSVILLVKIVLRYHLSN